MCGLAGVVSRRAPVELDELEALGRSLRHRGPDGVHAWTSEDRTCGLAHARLAILDVEMRSDQPFISGDGRYAIVFNGEIFNFLELRDELSARGIAFRTDSDTEVLLQSYLQWGADALLRFNGMWAVAIHDRVDGSLFLARDRFGIKPLYYANAAGRFAFASEVRALLTLPWVDRSPDVAVVRRQLFDPFGIEASEATLHTGIRRLPAGHSAVLRDGKLTMRRWWRTADHLRDAVPGRLADAAEQFRELFLDAVRLRMRSDVAIGSCLSGGFDSTAIVSAMRHIADDTGRGGRQASDWRHAFIATFAGHAHDESEEAAIAASHAAVNPHVLNLGGEDGTALIDTVLDALDDVYVSLPTAPWQIYREVHRAGVRVTLDGHGADELMGGYYPGRSSLAYRAKALVTGGASGTQSRVADLARYAVQRADGGYFLRGGVAALPAAMPIAFAGDRLPAHFGSFDRRLYGMFHATTLPTILRNFDRLSMAHGVEVRMPFMDWRLVTYVMSLPQSMKADERFTKLIAREAMAGIMPESIRSSPRKVGFNSQMPAWLNGSLGDWSVALLGRPNEAFDSFVDRRRLVARVTELGNRNGWTWESVGRIWPYINMKWYLDRRCA